MNYENDGNIFEIKKNGRQDNYSQIPMIHNWMGPLIIIVDCLPKMFRVSYGALINRRRNKGGDGKWCPKILLIEAVSFFVVLY